MRAYLIVIFHVRQQYVTKMPFTQDDDMIEHSLRIEPISRSAYPFCHGERGEVGRSRIPIDRSLRVKVSP